MADRIQLRRGTAAEWLLTDPVIAQGEPGWETNTNIFKIGDGITVWSLLPLLSGVPSVSITATVGGVILTEGTANVATGIAENSITISLSDFAGKRVNVYRGGMKISKGDPGTGNYYYTKILASTDIVLNIGLVNMEELYIETISN